MEHKNQKDQKAGEIIMRAASDFIQHESNYQSLITVTNIETSRDFRKATVFVTVFPEHKEEAAVDFLKRQRSQFKQYIKDKTRLARIPHFDFAIDLGEKARQRIDQLI